MVHRFYSHFKKFNALEAMSFANFLKWRAHVDDGHEDEENTHWKPIARRCHACSAACDASYRYIIKTENLGQEVEALLAEVKILKLPFQNFLSV